MIRIIAKKDGFRRAGMAHYGSKVYNDGHFTPEQVAQLKADPTFIVEEWLEFTGEESFADSEIAVIPAPEAEAPAPEAPEAAEAPEQAAPEAPEADAPNAEAPEANAKADKKGKR
jgi:hypothetical protein